MPISESRLTDEAGRLAALDRYGLRSVPEGALDGFQRITDLVANLLEAAMCSVSIITDEVQYWAAVTGEKAGLCARSEAVCTRTIERHVPLVIEDLTRDSRFANASFVTDERHFRSYAGTPLMTPDGYNLGALCVIDREVRDFSPREIDLLKRFAELVVEQMELRTLADKDFLTGAASRRTFTQRAAATLHRADAAAPAALVVVDVDHFKQINDRFGHARGDDVLRAMVRTMESQLRPGDLVGRIGGEEFAILLPLCGAAGAIDCAERYRAAIAEIRLKGLPPITASFGIASSHTSSTFEDWLQNADEALYEAKRAGRNRTRLACKDRVAA